MEVIFNDLILGHSYILQTRTQYEAESMIWPIVEAMFDTNNSVFIQGFDEDFLKRFLLPPTMEVKLRREYYDKLNDYSTLLMLEQKEIRKKWPLLLQTPTQCCLKIISDCFPLDNKSIQIVYTNIDVPRWTIQPIKVKLPTPTNTLIMSVIPMNMEKALQQIQKCAPLTDIINILKSGDCKVAQDAARMICACSSFEKHLISQDIQRTNNLRKTFDRKMFPRWDWCLNFLANANKVIVLTASDLPAGLEPCNHILTIPGVFHKCIHLDGQELGPSMTLHAQRAMNDFQQWGHILIITNVWENGESLAGNIPLWLRTTIYTDLILLDAAYQRWPLSNSILSKVNIWRVILSPYACKASGILWTNEKPDDDRGTSKFDDYELKRV
jgi:hypothetical protein